MTAAQDLMNNPRDFMKENIVIVLMDGDRSNQMDGCTFGIGMPNANGDRLVMHSNITAPNPMAQHGAQLHAVINAFAAQGGGIPEEVLAPLHYRQSRRGTMYKATTFGVRDNATGWHFYTQRYTL